MWKIYQAIIRTDLQNKFVKICFEYGINIGSGIKKSVSLSNNIDSEIKRTKLKCENHYDEAMWH